MAIIDYYDGSTDGGFTLDVVGENVGQAFTMGGVSKDISSAKFYLIVVIGSGVDTITLAAKIYACTGTPGTDGVETGGALATSDSIQYTDDLDATWVEFTFSAPYTLNASTNYCLVLECTAQVEDVVAMGVVSFDNTSPTHGGNYCYNSGTPGYNAGYDTNFYAYSSGWAGKLNGITPGKVNSVANIGKIIGV